MQYCAKCKNLVEDQLAVCPHCKRTRSLRPARQDDMVFLMKTTEFEASELGGLFEAHGVKYSAEPFSMGFVSSLYDSEVMPTDKNLFVALEGLETAKQLLEKERHEEEAPQAAPPTGKRIAVQILSIAAFLLLVAFVAISADWVFAFIKGLFL